MGNLPDLIKIIPPMFVAVYQKSLMSKFSLGLKGYCSYLDFKFMWVFGCKNSFKGLKKLKNFKFCHFWLILAPLGSIKGKLGAKVVPQVNSPCDL